MQRERRACLRFGFPAGSFRGSNPPRTSRGWRRRRGPPRLPDALRRAEVSAPESRADDLIRPRRSQRVEVSFAPAVRGEQNLTLDEEVLGELADRDQHQTADGAPDSD